MKCTDVIKQFEEGAISRNELVLRILETYQDENIDDIVNRLRPEEAELLKQMTSDMLFENGMTFAAGSKIGPEGFIVSLDESDVNTDHFPYRSLAIFKSYYGFDVPEKYRIRRADEKT